MIDKKELYNDISQDLFLSEKKVERVFIRSPHTYKRYSIPKRGGGKREIAQPARETKYIQSWLIENVYSKLPVHEAATAYRQGRGIKENVETHKDNKYFAKFDFENFFPSIKEICVLRLLERHFYGDYEAESLAVMARVACIFQPSVKELCLSIGAPSSPIISNAVMYDFDMEVSEWSASKGLTYTRYADDMIFSTNTKDNCREIQNKILESSERMVGVNLSLNTKKTTFLSKKSQRRVTGLIVNNDDQVSLGRAKKREIKALVHRFDIGALSDDDLNYLQGLLGFAKHVEPSFISSLCRKYGPEVIFKVLKHRKQ